MHLRELTIQEFNDFEKNHSLSNFYQTINYAMLMAENGYEYDLIGLVDDDNNILASSLILLKPIGIKCFYGYAPRGFLIDYHNSYLLKIFTTELKKYYYKKNVIFIKVNPNIPIGIIDNKTYQVTYNQNKEITNELINLGYKKLKDNLYFESLLPRFNVIIDMDNIKINNFSKNNKNKIKKGIRKGLTLEKVSKDNIKYIPNIDNEFYYTDYYTVFDKNNDVDLFLVSIDYSTFLDNSQYLYNIESEKNNNLNEKLSHFYSEKLINTKMHSDKVLLTYKNDIMEATKGITDNKKVYIAGALVIKHNDSASIVYSNFDKSYKRFAANYFLHYSIIKYYQDKYRYLDLNGIVGDFKDNPYHGLNRFKLGFNPNIYEFIGEFDLIIEEKSYDILLRNGLLAKEFNKTN